MASVVDSLTGEQPPLTSEDFHPPEQPSTLQWILAGSVVGLAALAYLSYQHFYMKRPGYFALPNGDDKVETLRTIGYVFAATAAIYGIFVGVGTGLSAYTAYMKCKKTDVTESAKQAAYYALNPAIAYLLIRTLLIIRRHYDRVLVWAGVRNVVWSIAAFMATWIIYQTILLVDESQRQICKATESEQTEFKKQVLADEAARKAKTQPPVGQPT
jgi:hypothetical protein